MHYRSWLVPVSLGWLALAASGCGVPLVTAGWTGWSRARMEGEPPIELGYADDATLAALYTKALALVYPSIYEGFGLPVLEAMRAVAPVLTTRAAYIPEIGGDAVRYADGRAEAAFAAALRAAVSLPAAARAQLVAAAKRRAETFTWDASAERLWYVLQQVARNRK